MSTFNVLVKYLVERGAAKSSEIVQDLDISPRLLNHYMSRLPHMMVGGVAVLGTSRREIAKYLYLEARKVYLAAVELAGDFKGKWCVDLSAAVAKATRSIDPPSPRALRYYSVLIRAFCTTTGLCEVVYGSRRMKICVKEKVIESRTERRASV